MPVLIIIALIAGIVYLGVSSLYHHLHMLQQNSYRIKRYWTWYKPRVKQEFRRGEVLLVLPIILAFFSPISCLISLIAVWILLLAIYWPRPKKDKKPLVLTKRAKRLYVTGVLLIILDIIGIYFIGSLPLMIAALFVISVLCRFYLILAAAIMIPVEKRINDGYLNQAKQKIKAMPDLVRIGITGSYGKTSSKMILTAILQEKFQTLATPGSFNTPMGITRVIRESLSPVDEIFVCEMGAKERGNIAVLADLVQPQIGLLTAIGEQHLQSFGSIDTITDTKFELIESLPMDGLAVVNGDDERIAANLHRTPCPLITYGFAPQNDYWADEIKYGAKGSSFIYHHQDVSAEFSTILLGKHMISNILAALAIADQLGLSMAQMQRGVKSLIPVEHRLQLRQAANYSIIDDAFNANPAGAEAALEVLASFTSGKKIIITPGMIELGEKEYQLNYQFGQQMAEVCDYIILVGKQHSLPLQEGVRSQGFSEDSLFIAANLNEARSRLGQIISAGDIVLFENDLPDTYNE